MTQETKEWYERAVMDLGVAKHLDETYHPKPIGIICYHCQQSAEKAIKALIMYYGAEGGMPKLHDLFFYFLKIVLCFFGCSAICLSIVSRFSQK